MKKDLFEKKRKIKFDKIPDVIRQSENKDIQEILESIEEYENEIFLTKYKSLQFYCIPETIFDMRGDGNVDNLAQHNVEETDEVEILSVCAKVYERKDKTQPGYIIMDLDDDYLIIELC